MNQALLRTRSRHLRIERFIPFILKGQEEDVEINLALAGQYLRQGRGAKAEEALRRVLATEPEFAKGHRLLGGALQN